MTEETKAVTAPLKLAAVQPVAEKKADIPIDPFTKEIIDTVNDVVENTEVQILVGKVTKNISAVWRDRIYTAGIIIGGVGTFATSVAAALTGDAQLLVATIGAVGLALTNTLSKLNLAKTPEEVAATA